MLTSTVTSSRVGNERIMLDKAKINSRSKSYTCSICSTNCLRDKNVVIQAGSNGNIEKFNTSKWNALDALKKNLHDIERNQKRGPSIKFQSSFMLVVQFLNKVRPKSITFLSIPRFEFAMTKNELQIRQKLVESFNGYYILTKTIFQALFSFMAEQVERLNRTKITRMTYVDFHQDEFWPNSIHLTPRSAHKRLSVLRNGFTLLLFMKFWDILYLGLQP